MTDPFDHGRLSTGIRTSASQACRKLAAEAIVTRRSDRIAADEDATQHHYPNVFDASPVRGKAGITRGHCWYYTNDYINQALIQAEAAGVDVNGSSFSPATVTLEAGGA